LAFYRKRDQKRQSFVLKAKSRGFRGDLNKWGSEARFEIAETALPEGPKGRKEMATTVSSWIES
jgi:hypothetical protein